MSILCICMFYCKNWFPDKRHWFREHYRMVQLAFWWDRPNSEKLRSSHFANIHWPRFCNFHVYVVIHCLCMVCSYLYCRWGYH